MVTVILLITKVGILYTYGGEFGGFDIDIGADEGIFDNWEEAEENQETTEPEKKENGAVMVMRVITTAIMTARMAVLAVMT